MTDYIDINQASKHMGVTIQAVYQAIRLGVLKATKRNGQKFTTLAWIEEFQSNKWSKQLHSRVNGKKVFRPESGELSIKMAAEKLNVPRHYIADHLKRGTIKGFRRGAYWVIHEEELQKLVNVEYKQKQA